MNIICMLDRLILHSLFNPWSTEQRNLNFQPLEVVHRYRDPQLQVTKNLCYCEI